MEALSEDLREELLSRMQTDEKAEVQELLSFPSETAGRIMTPNVFSLDESLTVGDAIQRLQDFSDELEAVFYVYVVDGRNHLVGVVSMRQLLLIFLRSSKEPLKQVMSTDVISVRTHTDQEEVTRMVANYNLLGIPVVDDENKLVGIITVDDVIDVIRDEATEDILGLAGVEADDRALGGPLRSFRRRIPWLLVSLVTAFLACYVVDSFKESVFANAVHYAVLLPLVAALGGQAATQTMTVVVRGISTGEVTSETRRRAFIKEVLVGCINGCVLGVLGGVAAGILIKSAAVGLVIFGSLVVLMVIAALAGTVVPFTLRRFNFDPAIASSVFVITITDVLGFFVYLMLASKALEYVTPASG
jgi:magnesium transporter